MFPSARWTRGRAIASQLLAGLGAGALLAAAGAGCRTARPPVARAPRPARIVVVGAGLSGLALALAPGAPEPEMRELSAEERALGDEGRTRRYLGIIDGLDPRAMQ